MVFTVDILISSSGVVLLSVWRLHVLIASSKMDRRLRHEGLAGDATGKSDAVQPRSREHASGAHSASGVPTGPKVPKSEIPQHTPS